MKRCTRCKTSMSKEFFGNNKAKHDGLSSECKPCKKINDKASYLRNKEKRLISCKAYVEKNKDKTASYQKQYVKDNIDAIKTYQAKWSQDNRDIHNAHGAKRRARKLNATPKWLSNEHLEKIKEIYKQGSTLNMHVDHIVPLQGKNVCGLHVHWNLQLLTPTENLSKGNKF